MRPKFVVPFILMIALALATPVVPAQVSEAQDGGDSCQQVVQNALTAMGTNCANLGPNSDCYAYAQVSATQSAGATTPSDFFNDPGYRTELTTLQSVTSSGLDVAAAEYGLNVMRVQANVHTSLGQSARYIMMGDVTVTNEVDSADAFLPGPAVGVTTTSDAQIFAEPAPGALPLGTVAAGTVLQADAVDPSGSWLRVELNGQVAWVSSAMVDDAGAALPTYTKDSYTPFQKFSFTTGFDNFGCASAPPSLILVQSPRDVSVIIMANDVTIEVNGTILLRSLPGDFMQLLTTDGEAIIYPGDFPQVTIPAGISVDIPLDGLRQWENWRVRLQTEWVSYGSIVFIPTNVIEYEIVIPNIISPSNIGDVVIIIEMPDGIYQIYPPVFYDWPLVELIPGFAGEPLTRPAWEALDIGCQFCAPELVLYASNSDGDYDVYRVVEDGMSEADNNLSQGPGSQDVHPTRSQDTAYYAFATNRWEEGRWEIAVGTTDGTRVQRLTYNTGNDRNPVWGPEGLLVWESDRDGNPELYMADLEGTGEPIRLTNDPANDVFAYWNPNLGGCDQEQGAELVMQSDRDGEWEIYLLDVETMEMTKLTDNELEDTEPIISPDGNTLAWLQEDEFGTKNLWVMDMTTLEAEQLTFSGDVYGHTFAPDGSVLAYYSEYDGDYDIFAVAVDGSATKQLTINTATDRSPNFRCDNSTVVFHSDVAATNDYPGSNELFETLVLPLDGPAAAATQLTFDVDANDKHPLTEREERNSLEGRAPAHP